ncbi:MAG: glucose-1-phosphate adenylyltransferase subunit GlgD [Clostridiaceae bacterium]|jgi:glucose-1-phosphate adenylyltransferase|nr:glucose-1-phosphate adenylyltransferase subunit GlgD [Clostridiaceae bacterium]HOA55420.1 glucose-1-phosphate adenylyltransferase subunit GlgD [Clostridiales bacterium]HPZ04504.1 glucose-1-phosphate adenylyltransferase subunit GlgD [Clostridiales bacterium]HQD30921.1 glucose-1-phosphate adenylyltransferase subunit GlgD [Clostridiales bacterium]
MTNTMGLILSGWKKPALKDLSYNRSVSAVPFGGKYRAIDFILSNMVNSGIKNVGVLTQYSFRSLMDHLGSGKEWDLDRRYDGLFIFPPSMSDDESGWYRGSADAMYNNLSFLKRSNEDYVVISQGNGIFKMQMGEMLRYHLDTDADITLAYRQMYDYTKEELSRLGIIRINEDNRVIDLQEKPLNPQSDLASIGIYILKRTLLIALLEECIAHGDYDFVRDIMIKKLDKLSIYGYEFKGYWRNISSVRNYYRCSMEVLSDPEIREELFVRNGKIYTKVKDEAPAKYNEEAEVTNSIVADGCFIEGTVENSVLFRGVTIAKGAVVRNSIVMQGSVIEQDAVLECGILDKNVVLTRGKYLKGDSDYPVVVSKNSVV